VAALAAVAAVAIVANDSGELLVVGTTVSVDASDAQLPECSLRVHRQHRYERISRNAAVSLVATER
jgi:hypothetical protein